VKNSLAERKALNYHSNQSKFYIAIHILFIFVDLPTLQTLTISTGLERITLHCHYEVTSDSPNVHQIEWKRNEEPLFVDHSKYLGGGIEDGYLTITSPTVDDAGLYTCIVANAVGAVSKDLMLGKVWCFY
jgi:hypothetical protein